MDSSKQGIRIGKYRLNKFIWKIWINVLSFGIHEFHNPNIQICLENDSTIWNFKGKNIMM